MSEQGQTVYLAWMRNNEGSYTSLLGVFASWQVGAAFCDDYDQQMDLPRSTAPGRYWIQRRVVIDG